MYKIFFLLFFISCEFQTHIKIKVNESVFLHQNREIIQESIQFYQMNCLTPNKINLNLKFDLMPSDLVFISQDKVAITSSFSDMTLIEVNPYLFNKLSLNERKNAIYHEIGHSIGLLHSTDKESIMYEKNTNKVNLSSLKSSIKNHCSKLSDVPRSQFL